MIEVSEDIEKLDLAVGKQESHYNSVESTSHELIKQQIALNKITLKILKKITNNPDNKTGSDWIKL